MRVLASSRCVSSLRYCRMAYYFVALSLLEILINIVKTSAFFHVNTYRASPSSITPKIIICSKKTTVYSTAAEYYESGSSGSWDENIEPLNQVVLVGRIGSNPEPKYLPDGKVVLNVSLAVKRQYNRLERKALKIKYGEEETDWFTLELWGQDAEFMSNYVTKGARIGVSGSLKIDTWADKATGERRTRPKIKVEEFHLLESRAEAQLRGGATTGARGKPSSSRSSFGSKSPSNISTGYRTKDESFYGSDEDDDDPFSSVSSGGSFF
mmetsp:Transcript_3635/g.5421  ORF Transcript_3635/g.5421 Transcript_3635/m.5421 type:complete len:267 (+) Transcript_3635:68-868(+)